MNFSKISQPPVPILKGHLLTLHLPSFEALDALTFKVGFNKAMKRFWSD